MGKTGVVNKH